MSGMRGPQPLRGDQPAVRLGWHPDVQDRDVGRLWSPAARPARRRPAVQPTTSCPAACSSISRPSRNRAPSSASATRMGSSLPLIVPAPAVRLRRRSCHASAPAHRSSIGRRGAVDPASDARSARSPSRTDGHVDADAAGRPADGQALGHREVGGALRGRRRTGRRMRAIAHRRRRSGRPPRAGPGRARPGPAAAGRSCSATSRSSCSTACSSSWRRVDGACRSARLGGPGAGAARAAG